MQVTLVTAGKMALEADADVWSRVAALRQNSLDYLAPRFRAALVDTLRDARSETVRVILGDGRADHVALDPIVHETLRTNELQQIYYEQGATRARTAEHSWHFYGLAADLISEQYGWFENDAARSRWPLPSDRARASRAWFGALALIASSHGLDWGGAWSSFPDLPHFQWGRCAPSPQHAPALYRAAGGGARGRLEVWRAVGADADDPPAPSSTHDNTQPEHADV